MITLKPHEILQKMGFDIGEDGIEINSNDAFLYDSTLKLKGGYPGLSALSRLEFEEREIVTELIINYTGW